MTHSVMPSSFLPYEGEPTPGFIAKMNFIVDMIIDPCDAPLMVWLELAVEPAGFLALGLVAVDPLDIVKNIHQPRNLASCRKARARPGGRRGGRSWIDFDELVADMVKGERKSSPIAWDGKRAMFLAAAGLIERAAWYWYVADLVTDAAYYWMSAVYKTEYCAAKAAGRARCENGYYAAIGAGDDNTVPLWGTYKQSEPGWVNLGGTGNRENPFDVAMTGTVRNYSTDTPNVVDLRMEVLFGGSWKTVQTKLMFLQPQESESFNFRYYVPEKGQARLTWSDNAGRTEFSNIQVLNVGVVDGGFRKVEINP